MFPRVAAVLPASLLLLALLPLSHAFDARRLLARALFASERQAPDATFPELSVKLPKCSKEQFATRAKSTSCFLRSSRNQTGTGACPDDCCCDKELTGYGLKAKFSAVGACTIHSLRDRNGKLLRLEIHPYGPVSTGSAVACRETTSDVCGPIIPKGGCSFQPSLPSHANSNTNNQSPSPTPLPPPAPSSAAVQSGTGSRSSRTNGKTDKGKNSKEKSNDSGSSVRKRNIILLSTTMAFLGITVIVSLLWFIIIPALRGMTNQSDVAGSDGSGSAVESFSSLGGVADQHLSSN